MSQIGHNRRNREDDKQSRFVDEISEWVYERRKKEALPRQSLGELSGIDRLFTLRAVFVDGLYQYYRANPQADAGPGLYALECFLSDNADGCCWLSSERAADFLGRTPRRIRQANKRLEMAGCITVEHRAGATSLVTPVINPLFAENRVPITWLLDAYAPKPSHLTAEAETKAAWTQVSRVEDVAPRTPVTPTPDACVQGPRTPASTNTAKENTTLEISKVIAEGCREREPTLFPPALAKSPFQENQVNLEEVIVEAVTQEEAERVNAVLEGQVLKPKKACSEGTSDSRRKSRSAAYPGDDCFDQADLDAALRAGLSRQEAKIQLAKFRDYNIARDSRFADWHAAWRSWVTNSIKYRSNRGPASGSGGPSMADLINDL